MDNSKIINVPIKYITKNPDNEAIFNMEGIETLARNIKEVGFIGSIDVIENHNTNTYEIISGHRRFAAAKLAGLEEIPVHIETVSDDIDKAKKLIRLNVNNRELNPLDKARAINYYIENVLKPENFKGNTQDKLSEVFGISVTQVKYLRRILKYPEPVQIWIGEGKLSYIGVSELSSLDEQMQKEAVCILENALKKNGNEPLSKSETQACIKSIKKEKLLSNNIEKVLSDKRNNAVIESTNKEEMIFDDKNIRSANVDNHVQDSDLTDLDLFRNNTAHGFQLLNNAFDNIPNDLSFYERSQILEQLGALLTKLRD